MLFYIRKKVLIDTLQCKDIQVAFVLSTWTSLLRCVPYNVELFYYNRHKKFSNFLKYSFCLWKIVRRIKIGFVLQTLKLFCLGVHICHVCVFCLHVAVNMYYVHCTGRSQLSHVILLAFRIGGKIIYFLNLQFKSGK